MAKIEHINPDTVAPYLPYGLSHAVSATGGRMVIVAGQLGWDKDGNIVGPDIESQLAQAHENIRLVLAAAGAEPKHIVRLTTYVANYSPADGEAVGEANIRFFGEHMPAAATLIGVQSLFTADFKVEVEATAIVP